MRNIGLCGQGEFEGRVSVKIWCMKKIMDADVMEKRCGGRRARMRPGMLGLTGMRGSAPLARRPTSRPRGCPCRSYRLGIMENLIVRINRR